MEKNLKKNIAIYMELYIYINESICYIPEINTNCKSTILHLKKQNMQRHISFYFLNCSCSTMLCQSLQYSKVTQLYI